jgi:hypothetical protein
MLVNHNSAGAQFVHYFRTARSLTYCKIAFSSGTTIRPGPRKPEHYPDRCQPLSAAFIGKAFIKKAFIRKVFIRSVDP